MTDAPAPAPATGAAARPACSPATAELFFARPGTPAARAAAGLCATCPLQAACGLLAADAGERHGIWGGGQRRPGRARKAVAA